MEFLYRHASAASRGRFHSHFGHYHLHFDRTAGREEIRSGVNRLLARNGLVYELNETGRVTRLTSAVVERQLRSRLPATRDGHFDSLIEAATRKHTDPDPAVRRDALEKLWDAFEQCKTMLDPDKKNGAKALVAACARSPRESEMLSAEMKELTTLGNEFAIRHHETRTAALDEQTIDHLFARMYAFVLRVHLALR